MSVCAGGARLVRRAGHPFRTPVAELPLFLCPGWIGASRAQFHYQQSYTTSTQTLHLTSTPTRLPQFTKLQPSDLLLTKLPPQCSGCGALSQVVDKDEAGYYNLKRRSVSEYLRGKSALRRSEEDAIIEKSLQAAAAIDPEILKQLSFQNSKSQPAGPLGVTDPPLCDRCHNIKHHDTGVSIHHPSIYSIKDTLFESPHKINHVYHIIDAADFPMSIIPGLHKLLHITPQRSLNRRSKTGKFYQGKKTEVSFVITRSDLLAPKKEQVNAMMPYLRDVLRDALGRAGKGSRLGNVRCVSAKQGWWTKELKEDIWKRGGAGWMVGKVNVGKSQLFGEIFPKGRRESSTAPERESAEVSQVPLLGEATPSANLEELESVSNEYLDTNSLLPPAQEETDYPEMPLVSSLPGTTASPIRVPYGNGRGELIDLPGLARGDLELHVQPEHRPSLIMRSRIRPEQQSIKPGQSLLLGGFIRITPITPNLVFLAYSFNPLKPHLTSTEKAIGTQTQTRESNVENISVPGTGENIASAGRFHLKWDVTKQRTGPVTAREAANIKVERLPYRVMAADILIEGVGWVELVAQIRRQPSAMLPETKERNDDWTRGEKAERHKTDEKYEKEDEEIDPDWPSVEVFSPDGKFIGVRRPMNAWVNFAKKPSEKNLKSRPRRSMKGMKKLAKSRARAGAYV
ncbi:hypothetical protein OIDMADRAFT_159973 [Oidiodendron maius Zn]|uniref:G domain-containing protein n=1 Tax=Oidiodendron maius (strain Zn) TaxID=913774 RepID=A0A0C3DKL2_OIDMZ|nr:hypothetical protein OIDMADRAFT_159973 [Oidiodendron maius Zn]